MGKRMAQYSDDEDSSMSGDDSMDTLRVASSSQSRVRDELEKALSEDVKSSVFVFRKTYGAAPNPMLKLSGLGTVGLPLSDRDADAIQKAYTENRTSEEAQTSWNVSAKTISFANKNWNDFITRVMKDALETFCFSDLDSNIVRHELNKMMLCGPGSALSPYLQTQPPAQAFATLVVFLPSEFAGGALQFSHGGSSQGQKTSRPDSSALLAVAWHADVAHTFAPITSGHCLAVSYSLMCPEISPRPSLPDNTAFIERLSNIFRTWRGEAGTESPEQIIYLLEDHYSAESRLHLTLLKGSDARKAAMLDHVTVARQQGFGVGLALARFSVSGYSRDGVDFEESDTDMTFTNVVTLQGTSVTAGLKYNDEDELIPEEMSDVIGEDEYDSDDYEESECYLQRSSSRIVLVIWPDRNNIKYSGKPGFERACNRIAQATSRVPTPGDKALAESLLARRYHGSKISARAARVLCEAACTWNDLELWRQTVSVFGSRVGVDVFSGSTLLLATNKFGFASVKSSVEDVLRADQLNARRLSLLSSIGALLSGDESPCSDEVAKEVLEWSASQTYEVLRTLKGPLIMGDASPILDACAQNGSDAVLRDIVFPQVLSLADAEFLTIFAKKLALNDAFTDSTSAEICPRGLSAAISQVVFVEPKPLPSWQTNGSERRRKEEECLERTKYYLQICLTRLHDVQLYGKGDRENCVRIQARGGLGLAMVLFKIGGPNGTSTFHISRFEIEEPLSSAPETPGWKEMVKALANGEMTSRELSRMIGGTSERMAVVRTVEPEGPIQVQKLRSK